MTTLRYPRKSRKHSSLMMGEDDDPIAAGGVFVSMRRSPSVSKYCSLSSISTADTECETSCLSPASSWKTSGSRDYYHGNSKLIVSEKELQRIVEKSKRLPHHSWYYASNHIMINNERTKNLIAPLTRLSKLDQIARENAEAMACKNALFHTAPEDLQAKFQRPSRRLGENVSKGDTIPNIHNAMMETLAHRNNILDRRYTHMGMATARGKDGDLYLCQVFRG